MTRRSRLLSFGRDRDGATLVEFSILLPLLLILTFGIVEFSLIMWQHQQAEMGLTRALRFATTRALIPADTSIEDCGVTTSATAGTSCSNVAGSTGWSHTCTIASPGVCDADILDDMLAEIQAINPNVTASNMEVIVEGAGLGFVGFGRPVPLITVRLTGVDYQFIALGGLVGLADITMPDFEATAPAEDLSGA